MITVKRRPLKKPYSVETISQPKYLDENDNKMKNTVRFRKYPMVKAVKQIIEVL